MISCQSLWNVETGRHGTVKSAIHELIHCRHLYRLRDSEHSREQWEEIPRLLPLCTLPIALIFDVFSWSLWLNFLFQCDTDTNTTAKSDNFPVSCILKHCHLCLPLSGLLPSPLLLSDNFPRHGEGSGSSSGSYVRVFPMQLHRKVFVSPPGFRGPRCRAVPRSTDSTMGLYAAKAPLPHASPSCFLSSGA